MSMSVVCPGMASCRCWLGLLLATFTPNAIPSSGAQDSKSSACSELAMEDAECLGWSLLLLLCAQATARLSCQPCSLAAEGQGAPLSPTSKTAAAARLSKAARKLEVRC